MVSMRYISPIDPHVHLRWHENDETYMHFMQLAFEDARDVGLAAVIAQGNTQPFLTEKEPILEYIKRADKYRGDIEFAVHGVLTANAEQQERMFNLAEDLTIPVVSTKIFYSETTNTGTLEITDRVKARESWFRGAERRFNGNRTGHFEDGELFVGRYAPVDPSSHSRVQPPEAELAKVQEQYKNAYDADFAGNFIVFHTSNPATPKWIRSENAKMHPRFRTYLEVTPHHALLNTSDYAQHGAYVKINPPIRTRQMQEELFEEVMRGNIHMIGSDHAPHTMIRKQGDKPASGTPCILAIPLLIDRLRKAGIKPGRLDNLLFHNANRVYFDGRIKPRQVKTEYKPERWIERYGHNSFDRIDGSNTSAAA